jgi:exonuclease SbcD
MRILHTADWHLGRRLNRASRLAEQRSVCEQLVEATRRRDPDAVVVAGDVFDVFTPGAGAERLYYDTVQALADGGRRPVLVVAGNHDSPARLTAPGGLLATEGVLVFGDPHDEQDAPEPGTWPGFEVLDSGPGWVRLSVGGERALFHLLPFPARSRLPARVDEDDASATEILRALQGDLPDVDEAPYLVGHLHVGGDHDVEEDTDDYVGGAYAVAPEVLDAYEAAFLGHLHRPFGTDTWRYAGAPLPFDFDDPDVDRGAWLYEDGDWTQVGHEAGRPLVVHRPGSVDEALDRAAEATDAWTRLVFERGTVLTRSEREDVRGAFGDRLVDIRFEEVEQASPEETPTVDVAEVDPEEAFRGYVEELDGEAPDEELVDLFLEVLAEDPDEDAGEAEQATPEGGP